MLQKGSLAKKLYGKDMVLERHRHRYEINNSFREQLKDSDWIASGIFEEGQLVEMAEIKNHPYMIGTQSHPEFLSRPHRPHPLFSGLIEASHKRHTNASTTHGSVSVHSS